MVVRCIDSNFQSSKMSQLRTLTQHGYAMVVGHGRDKRDKDGNYKLAQHDQERKRAERFQGRSRFST